MRPFLYAPGQDENSPAGQKHLMMVGYATWQMSRCYYETHLTQPSQPPAPCALEPGTPLRQPLLYFAPQTPNLLVRREQRQRWLRNRPVPEFYLVRAGFGHLLPAYQDKQETAEFRLQTGRQHYCLDLTGRSTPIVKAPSPASRYMIVIREP